MVEVRIGAVVAEFNYDITHMMLELAREHAKFRLRRYKGYPCPGSL